MLQQLSRQDIYKLKRLILSDFKDYFPDESKKIKVTELLADNKSQPYHNTFHMLVTGVFVYLSLLYDKYGMIKDVDIFTDNSLRESIIKEYMPLILAGFLHDIGHGGFENKGKDYKNIENTISILREQIRDSVFLNDIIKYIKFTEFPYNDTLYQELLEEDRYAADILRSADLASIFLSDINILGLCYTLHGIELRNLEKSLEQMTNEDIKKFMQNQYKFYSSGCFVSSYTKDLEKTYLVKCFSKWL